MAEGCGYGAGIEAAQGLSIKAGHIVEAMTDFPPFRRVERDTQFCWVSLAAAMVASGAHWFSAGAAPQRPKADPELSRKGLATPGETRVMGL